MIVSSVVTRVKGRNNMGALLLVSCLGTRENVTQLCQEVFQFMSVVAHEYGGHGNLDKTWDRSIVNKPIVNQVMLWSSGNKPLRDPMLSKITLFDTIWPQRVNNGHYDVSFLLACQSWIWSLISLPTYHNMLYLWWHWIRAQFCHVFIFCIMLWISLKFVIMCNWQYPSIGLENGLAPNRWQAIIWTNAETRYTETYMQH